MSTGKTKLHTDSLQIHAKRPDKSHSDLLRTIVKCVDDLTALGILSRSGSQWSANGVVAVEEFTYVDSVQRTQKALRFGSWLCLVLVLKVTQEAVRQALTEALLKHPKI